MLRVGDRIFDGSVVAARTLGPHRQRAILYTSDWDGTSRYEPVEYTRESEAHTWRRRCLDILAATREEAEAALWDDLEPAAETVVDWLATHGHEELARQVALATDPTPPEEHAEQVEMLREGLRFRPEWTGE